MQGQTKLPDRLELELKVTPQSSFNMTIRLLEINN